MIIFDQEKCTGCEVCSLVCSLKQENVMNTAKARIQISTVEREDGVKVFKANVCNQCGRCIRACPQKAIYWTEDRVVKTRKELCIGCLACVEVCPTKTRFTHPDLKVPFNCDECGECVALCPQGALSFKVKKTVKDAK